MKTYILSAGLLLTSLVGQPLWAQNAELDEAQLAHEHEMQREKERQEKDITYPDEERQEEQVWEEGDLQIQEEEVQDADPEFAPIDGDLESEAY